MAANKLGLPGTAWKRRYVTVWPLYRPAMITRLYYPSTWKIRAQWYSHSAIAIHINYCCCAIAVVQ